jgi:hypothetical protein
MATANMIENTIPNPIEALSASIAWRSAPEISWWSFLRYLLRTFCMILMLCKHNDLPRAHCQH